MCVKLALGDMVVVVECAYISEGRLKVMREGEEGYDWEYTLWPAMGVRNDEVEGVIHFAMVFDSVIGNTVLGT